MLAIVPQLALNGLCVATDHNSQANALRDVINGQLDDTNIASVSGSKIGVGTIPTTALADKAVTTAKLKPNAAQVATTNGVSRQSIPSATPTLLTGMTLSYTSGPTAELLIIDGSGLVNGAAGGSGVGIYINGTLVGQRSYTDISGSYVTGIAKAKHLAAANTAYTIELRCIPGTSTAIVANGDADTATALAPRLSYEAYAR